MPPLLPHIMSKYRDITVCADVMKTNRVRFFMSIFKSILFCIAEYCDNGKEDTFMICTRNIQRLAAKCGFRVVQFNMDGEFASLRTNTYNLLINIASHEDHVLEAEKNTRTAKDHTRSTLASL